MKNKMAVGCVLIALSVAVFSLEIQHKCEIDSDCKADHYYCHLKVCERCIPCDLILNRQPSELPGNCARSEDDCGLCLPGFQAEDLTNQRRSLKCFPIEELVYRPSSTKHIPWITVAIIVTIFIVTMVLTALATYYYKKGQSTEREIQVLPQSETAKMIDQRLPPPYEDIEEELDSQMVGRARESACSFTLVEPDITNQASPIGPYHHHQDANEEDTDDSLPLALEAEEHPAELNGSTETIPSAWEPDVEPEEGTSSPHPVVMCSHHHRLVKSVSLDSALCQSGSIRRLSNSQSEPALPTKSNSDVFRRNNPQGETYLHRHVHLSRFRSPQVALQHRTPSTLDDSEPKAPESFTFHDDSHSDGSGGNHQVFNMLNSSLQSIPRSLMMQILSSSSTNQQDVVGSQDSGYFGQDQQSRRRPNSEMFELEMTFFVKRRRDE